MSRLRTSCCNFLSLFSTFLPVQPVVQITAHIRIYNLDITCLKPFWGVAPFGGQKRMPRRAVGLERSPCTFSIMLTPIRVISSSVPLLNVCPSSWTFAFYNYCSSRAFWYVWKALSNQTKALLLGESAIQFSLNCNYVSIIRQVFPRTVWNRSGWGGRPSCSSHGIRLS